MPFFPLCFSSYKALLEASASARCLLTASDSHRTYVRYWNDLFRSVQGKAVHARYDPFDASMVYAFVEEMWVVCRAWSGFVSPGTTERELHLASLAYRQNAGAHAKNRMVSSTILAAFLRETDDQEVLLQRRRDRALAGIFSEPTVPAEVPPQKPPVPAPEKPPVVYQEPEIIEPYEEL